VIVVSSNQTGLTLPYLADADGAHLSPCDHDERIAAIRAGLLASERCGFVEPAVSEEVVQAALARVHEPAYLAFLDRSNQRLGAPLLSHEYLAPGVEPDTPLVAGYASLARRGAHHAVDAADRVLAGAPMAYALARPPGHHAGPAFLGGYCLLNNAALAAVHLLCGDIRRVAILDVDCHVGNGTMECVARHRDVFYASIHADPKVAYPYTPLPATSDNLALRSFSDAPSEAAYLRALDGLIARIEGAKCEALVLSLGYDIVEADPHGAWTLSSQVFAAVGARVRATGLPLVIVQEGGYDLRALPHSAEAFARGVTGGQG
jgi:acetoin utilization deacetylase AcuC-like enzyme